MIYVDSMVDWGKRIGRAGPLWAHLMADTEEELHEFANTIGLKRSWFQGDHYDIGSAAIWEKAVKYGAIHQKGREWMMTVVRLRKKWRNNET